MLSTMSSWLSAPMRTVTSIVQAREYEERPNPDLIDTSHSMSLFGFDASLPPLGQSHSLPLLLYSIHSSYPHRKGG